MERVVRMFLFPENSIHEAYPKVEAGFHGFEKGYFDISEGASKGNAKRRRLTRMDSNLTADLMYSTRTKPSERSAKGQKFKPSFWQYPISRGTARIDKGDINYDLFSRYHVLEWALTMRSDSQSWAQAFKLQFNSVVHSLRTVFSSLCEISEIRVVLLHPFFVFAENIGLSAENIGLPSPDEDQSNVCEHEKSIEYYFGGLAVVFLLGIVGIELDYGRYARIGRLLIGFWWLYFLCGDLFLGFLLLRWVILRS